MQENESAMQYQNLGKTDVLVSRIGVGCYNMTSAYGKSDPQDARNTIFRAIELGVNFFDTADSYAFGKNEELVGQALKGRRQNIILATKFGQVVSPDGKREI
jgi:aryl-alcohol dehydrogenase-like predicted oxidoreductase